MPEKIISPEITVGPQPTPAGIQQLHDRGFRTVVNMRQPGEPGYLADEERLVENTAMNYADIPVSPQTVDIPTVLRFSQALTSVDSQPAYVHCQGGGRAGIMVLIHLAITHGWSVQQALEEGEKLGIAPASTSPYRAFFESTLHELSAGER